MRNMFEVVDELQWLQAQEYDGVPVDPAWMDEVRAELDDVIASLVAILKEAKADLKSLNDARAALAKKQQHVHQRVDELKGMILVGMQASKSKRAGSAMHSATITDSTPRVEVLDETQIPDHFFELRRVLQKSAIADSINQGLEVPGAQVVRGQHVRIR